jgi:hypothetical protein
MTSFPFRCPHCDRASELQVEPGNELETRCPVCKMAVRVPCFVELDGRLDSAAMAPHLASSAVGHLPAQPCAS